VLNAFVEGFLNVFTWPTFGMMLIGIAIGFVIGLLPGIGSGVGLALMLPLTFAMSPVEAMAFLLGMLSVAASAGDITSVLFGIPGEATTAATVLDGLPMTQQGQAGRALGAALTSSAVGAVFGALVLVVTVPLVEPMVMAVGTGELFALCVVGITLVATISGRGNIRLGMISAGLGLMLSFVGFNSVTGAERFTFGSLYMYHGIDLVSAVVGLFGVPQVLSMLSNDSGALSRVPPAALGGIRQGIVDTFRHWALVLRCCTIGTVLGLVPGLGPAVGHWVAYGHAVQSSRDKSRFGRGDVRGVLGPCAATNAKEGGNLITTVGFGIPTTVGMAVLLGAFIIQGLQPGRDMLTTNLDVTFSMVWVIIISDVILVALSLLFLRQIVRLAYVRSSLIAPFILVFLFVGAYVSDNSFGNVFVMLVFGVLGVVMLRLGWPRPPLILGLVLGHLSETYLWLAVGLNGWHWLARPLVIGLFAVALLSMASQLVRRRTGALRLLRRERTTTPDERTGAAV
jgi:TctA family transporter